MVRIPINGIGIIAPGAIGIEGFRALLSSGSSAAARVDRFDTEGLSAHTAALVSDFKPRELIAPMKLRRMNTLSRFGVGAARLAIDETAVALDSATGVAIGTAFGPVQTSVDYMKEYMARGAALAPPQLFAESVANAPGSHIAIEWGLRGANVTVTQRESSALTAAMLAATQIAKGTIPAAVIGGVEETTEMLFSVLDRVGALAHASGDLAECARPMDRQRNGCLLGEGGVAIVAGIGAARISGWFSGFAMGRDTTASLSDWGTGAESVARTMRAAVNDAGLEPGDIDAIYCSASGAPRGDALEQSALLMLFGEALPPVVATKGIFGEYAAGGALQLAAAIVAVEDQTLHASVGFQAGEIELNRQVRPAAIRHLLVNSISAGGGIVAAVISREDG